MKVSIVIEKLCDLISLLGFSGYIHSDHLIKVTKFMSSDLKEWLHGKGIPTSRITRYNPQGNSQVERFNGVVWKSILLGLRVQIVCYTLGKCFTRCATFITFVIVCCNQLYPS